MMFVQIHFIEDSNNNVINLFGYTAPLCYDLCYKIKLIRYSFTLF